MKFLMKAGDEHVDKYNLSSLKVLTLGNQSFYFARTNVPLIKLVGLLQYVQVTF